MIDDGREQQEVWITFFLKGGNLDPPDSLAHFRTQGLLDKAISSPIPFSGDPALDVVIFIEIPGDGLGCQAVEQRPDSRQDTFHEFFSMAAPLLDT